MSYKEPAKAKAKSEKEEGLWGREDVMYKTNVSRTRLLLVAV